MSYPDGFYQKHIAHQQIVAREKRIVQEFPPPVPSWDRESLYSSEAAYGTPGCLSLETKIQSPKGNRALADVLGETIRILSYDWIRHEIVEADADVLTREPKKTFLIRTESGATVCASSEHRFFVLKEKGISEAMVRDIRMGNKLATVSESSARFEQIISIEEQGESVVADLVVPGPNNFILENGIVSHNSGKTMAIIYDSLERYMNLHKPELGVPRGMKIIWMDLLGKAEIASASIPIDSSHPLYEKYVALGGVPESYPVEIYRPLVFVTGQPYLEYRQPKVVKPFTISLQDLTNEEWKSFLAPPTPSQERLHDAVLKTLRARPDWAETTIDDLYATAQGMLGSRRIGFSRHIEGMDEAESIPLASHTYSSREAAGLLQRYEKLMDLSLIMPEQWKGKPVETNLDIRGMLEREVKWQIDGKTRELWPISAFLLPDVPDAPFLSYGLANYVLTRIFWMKHTNNRDRVKVPLTIVIPEASKSVPKEIRDKDKRHFIEPLKSTVIRLSQQAPGMGIQLSVDSQRPRDLDEAFRDTNANLKIFDLGEEAAEIIRELLRGRYVSNYKEITDENSRFLTALRERGTFVHIGIGSTYAELASNCVCGFWYPRASGASGESETSFYELYERKGKPEDWADIGHMYAKLLVVNLEAQNRAAATMREMMEKEEKEKGKQKNRKQRNYERPEDRIVLGFMLDLFKETGLDHWDSYEDFVKRLSEKASLPRSRIWQILAKFNSKYLLMDRTESKKRGQRVTLLIQKIQEKLNENTDAVLEE